MNWKDAVRAALDRYAHRHATVQIERGQFLEEEQALIVEQTGSVGITPGQTISRIFQELREDGLLYFSSAGQYVLNDRSFDASAEDVTQDVLDNAIAHGNLVLRDIDASDRVGNSRIRQGMGALRQATLFNYGASCALCDIRESTLLVTSHVARWADRPAARGLLSNTICFCNFHDRLFETGFFSLTDDLQVIKRPRIESKSISTWLDRCTTAFKAPHIEPSVDFLREHRNRARLSN